MILLFRKNILFFFYFSLFSIYAQKENVDFGSSPDLCKAAVAQFQAKVNQYLGMPAPKNVQLLEEARTSFESTLNICPRYSENNYLRAQYMMKELIRVTENVLDKKTLLEQTFVILDKQLSYFNGRPRTDEGIILGVKGALLYDFNVQVQKKITQEEFAKNLVQAIRFMQDAVNVRRQATDVEVLLKLFKAKLEVFNNKHQGLDLGKEEIKRDFVLFSRYISQEIQRNTTLKNDPKAKQLVSVLQKINQDMQANFLQSKAFSCKDLNDLADFSTLTPEEKQVWEKNLRELCRNEVYIRLAEDVCRSTKDIQCFSGLTKAYLENGKLELAVDSAKKVLELCGDCQNAKTYSLWFVRIAIEAKNFNEARKQATGNLPLQSLILSREVLEQADKCGSQFEKKAVYWLAYDHLQNFYASLKDEDEKKRTKKMLDFYRESFPNKEELFNEGLKDGDAYTFRCFDQKTVKARARQYVN